VSTDFRDRFLLPILVPLGIILYFIGAAYALSRILLAVPSVAATAVAIGLAVVILAAIGYTAGRSRATVGTAALAVTSALVAILVAGTYSAAAGPRADLAALVTPAGVADEALFVAIDIDYLEAPEALPAGEHEFVLENRGRTRHTVTIAELGDLNVVLARGGETATGTVSLDPGDYYYYCEIADHEQRGMFGTLEVRE
jgi:plastocyanin